MSESAYRIVEVVGTSPTSWEEAAKMAVNVVSEHVRDLRVAEVVKLDMAMENGKIAHYRARLNLSFKYEKP